MSIEELERENARLRGEVERLSRAAGEVQERVAPAPQMDDALESQLILDAVMEHAPVGIIVATAPDVRLRRFSRYAQEPTGRTDKALKDAPLHERPQALGVYCLDGETQPDAGQLPLTRATLQGETVRNEEWIVRRTDGELLHVLCNAGPIRDASGQITGGVLAWMDITARKQAEQALAESEARYRLIVENQTEFIVRWLPDSTRTFVNESYCRYFGGTREQLVGTSFLPLVAPEQREAVRRKVASLTPEHPVALDEHRARRADGVWRWQQWVDRAIFDEQGHLVELQSVGRDVEELKQVEEALCESEERYRRLVERSPDAIFVFVEGKVAFANPAGVRLFGAERPEDLHGRSAFSLVHPDYEDAVCERYQQLSEHQAPTLPMEQRILRLDGTEVDVETSAVPVSYRGVPAIQSTVRDVSERRRAERARAEALERERAARAEAQEANAAKDRFIAVLSHELRNPLAPILAGVGVLRRSCEGDERALRTLDIMERNTKLQARLVDDLLDLSRIAGGKIRLQRTPVALDSVVKAALQMEQSDAEKAGLSLTSDLEPGLWVLGDPDRLQQVVANLLGNSIKFTPTGGAIRVGLHAADGSARLVVEDTGVGIPAELLPRLFTIFQQGEIAGKRKPGLGIGLALVKSFTEAQGGHVWAESEGSGKGSRFTVELPLVAAPAAHGAPGEQPEGDGRIEVLLVEDNADTLTVLTDGLELMGYQVLPAATGEAALEVLHEARPDVILSDIGLPGIDGYEFLRRARELPGVDAIPAFALTGWGREEDVRQAREAGYVGHLTKPVDVSVLDERIRERLR